MALTEVDLLGLVQPLLVVSHRPLVAVAALLIVSVGLCKVVAELTLTTLNTNAVVRMMTDSLGAHMRGVDDGALRAATCSFTSITCSVTTSQFDLTTLARVWLLVLVSRLAAWTMGAANSDVLVSH